MDFDYDESTADYRRELREFAAKRLAPRYQEGDREGRPHAGLREELARMGLLGLRAPTDHGGQGASALATGAALEELARADLNTAYLVLAAALVCEVLNGGDAPGEWLRGVASGEALPCLALTEPEHGSDAAAIELAATTDGGDWLLHGEKTSVSLGRHADTAVVFARTGDDGARGVSAFYVDLHDESIARGSLRDLGSRAAGRATLHFDDVRVPGSRLLGRTGEGFVLAMRGFSCSRAWIGLMCVACAQASLEEACSWARERTAFGRPIGSFQGVAFPLVEYSTQLHAARLLCLQALSLRDRGEDPTVLASMAKWWAPRLAVEAAHAALLTFGHAGYCEELPLGQRVRDLIGLEIGDGTAQIAKLVVARDMLGREHAP